MSLAQTYYPTLIARQFLFIREAQSQGQNHGLWVEAIQHAAGGSTGDSWCMEFVWDVECICYQGAPPIPRMQSCEALHQYARAHGMVIDAPTVNCIVLFLGPDGIAHHVGIVTSIDPLSHISGNTSAPDAADSFNGDRVAEKPTKARVGGSLVFVDISISTPTSTLTSTSKE